MALSKKNRLLVVYQGNTSSTFFDIVLRGENNPLGNRNNPLQNSYK